jgi:hypothetical protein
MELRQDARGFFIIIFINPTNDFRRALVPLQDRSTSDAAFWNPRERSGLRP